MMNDGCVVVVWAVEISCEGVITRWYVWLKGTIGVYNGMIEGWRFIDQMDLLQMECRGGYYCCY